MDWLDFLFPRRCVNCGRWGNYVCDSCEVGLWEADQVCPTCFRPSRFGLPHAQCHRSTGLTGLTCLWTYQGIAKRIINKANKRLTYHCLSELINRSDFLSSRDEFGPFIKFLKTKPLVVAVPIPYSQKRKQGFSTAEMLASFLAKQYHLQIGHTSNLPTPELSVVLVSDIYKPEVFCNQWEGLKKLGVREVWGLVLAR